MFAIRAVFMLIGVAAIGFYMHTISTAVSPGYAAPRPDTASCRELRADFKNARMAEYNGYSSGSGYDHSASDAIRDKMSAQNCSESDPNPDPNETAAYDSTPSRAGQPTLHLPSN